MVRLTHTSAFRSARQHLCATPLRRRSMSARSPPCSTREGVYPLPDGAGRIAYRLTDPPAAPSAAGATVMFLHGLCSDMLGTKAQAIEQHARQAGFACLCFDQRGHGSSSGTFEGTHIGQWYADAEAALCQIAPQDDRHILVGSSLGGWLALQLAVRHPERVAGLLLLAPALDFTERLWASLSAEQQAAAQASGRVPVASNYMEPTFASLSLIEQGRQMLMLDKLQQLRVTCPCHIIHGVQDDAVPVGVSEQVFELLGCEEMALTLVKDGDHRLSRPQDIRLLLSTLDNLRVLVLSKQEH